MLIKKLAILFSTILTLSSMQAIRLNFGKVSKNSKTSSQQREELPTVAPTDLQEKLAWGLCKLDKQVVAEALDAGADPFACGTTKVLKIHVRSLNDDNRFGVFLDARQRISPYFPLFITLKKSQWVSDHLDEVTIAALNDFLNMALLLIKRGISVDRGVLVRAFGAGDHIQTFREKIEKAAYHPSDFDLAYNMVILKKIKDTANELLIAMNK
jgi:hypothetical protein